MWGWVGAHSRDGGLSFSQNSQVPDILTKCQTFFIDPLFTKHLRNFRWGDRPLGLKVRAFGGCSPKEKQILLGEDKDHHGVFRFKATVFLFFPVCLLFAYFYFSYPTSFPSSGSWIP